MPTDPATFSNKDRCKQRGAALLIMLVIVILAVAAVLLSSLRTSSINNAHQATTADALAKAKEALIARAVSDLTSPGSLPCPDADGDGSADLFAGNRCPYYIGKLPWKSLGLPDLRDGSGEELWYALTPNFRDFASVVPVNSDSQGTLNVTGTAPANNIVAIVFSAGDVLSGQDRSSTIAACTTTGTSIAANLCATNYLEGTNATLSTAASPNSAYQTAASSGTFNDQVIYITHDQLLAPVEMRIAREAKHCFDSYAALPNNTNNKYPWAAWDNDLTYTGQYATYFGRIAAIPVTQAAPVDPYASTMLSALSNLQMALNNYSANVNSTTTSALLSAGQTLSTAAHDADIHSSSSFHFYNSITGNGTYAGNRGSDLANGVGGVNVTTVQGYIDLTNSYLSSNGFVDGSMPIYWPSGCVFSASYWSAWQNEVFYEVTYDYSPKGGGNCVSSCLTINGSGNTASGNGTYRAAVIVGRGHNASGSVTSNPPTYYLEGSNLHDSSQTSFTTAFKTFQTYRSSDPGYATVNDLVLCLDGMNNCK